MDAAKIPSEHWVSRLMNFLLGQVLKRFQNLSSDEMAFFATVREKLLA